MCEKGCGSSRKSTSEKVVKEREGNNGSGEGTAEIHDLSCFSESRRGSRVGKNF